jgi:hypothetical protein
MERLTLIFTNRSILGMRPDNPRLVAARHRFADRYGLSDDEISRAAHA